MKKIVILLTIFLFLNSCSDDEQLSNNLNLPKKTSLYENGILVDENHYTYNGNKIVSIEGQSLYNEHKVEFNYNGDLIISKIDYVKYNNEFVVSNTSNYEYYSDGKIRSLEDSRNGIPLKSKFVYTYESDGSVLSLETNVNDLGEEFLHSESHVLLNGGNASLKTTSLYNFSTLTFDSPSFTKEFVWDNKNKIYKNIVGINKLIYPTYEISLDKNLIQVTTTNLLSGSIDIVDYEYEYNSDNFPIIKREYSNGQLIRVLNIEYY